MRSFLSFSLNLNQLTKLTQIFASSSSSSSPAIQSAFKSLLSSFFPPFNPSLVLTTLSLSYPLPPLPFHCLYYLRLLVLLAGGFCALYRSGLVWHSSILDQFSLPVFTRFFH